MYLLFVKITILYIIYENISHINQLCGNSASLHFNTMLEGKSCQHIAQHGLSGSAREKISFIIYRLYMNKFDFVLEEIKTITKNATDKTEFDHSQSVWQWVLKLKPEADVALQIAALGHDIDRSLEDYRKMKARFATYDEYKKEHALQSAKITCDILKKHDFDETTINKVMNLIENHEVGGEGDVEILMEADSITFFNNIQHYQQTHTQAETTDKIKFMYNRLNDKAKSMVNQIDFKNTESAILFKEAINSK